MTPQEERILALANDISLARTGRPLETDEDELEEMIDQTISWTNQYLEELEMEADWNFTRENDHPIVTSVSADEVNFGLPVDTDRLVFSAERDVTIVHDGSVVATFRLVAPNQIANPSHADSRDRATVVGRSLILSRPITDAEAGGDIHADVIQRIPRLSRDAVDMLDLVRPMQLVVLGVAKNWSLPDIVQGEISPILAQKYTDLLNKAIAKNNATAESEYAMGEDFSSIQGVW